MLRKPKHIGIIPDGNRRWAERHGLNKQDGYAYGLSSGLRLLHAAASENIEELTFYGFTVDNCKRPAAQVSSFTEACLRAVELIADENVDLRVIGNSASKCFPKALIPYTQSRPRVRGRMRVNFLVNYGWEWDMRGGFISRDIPRVDLVIRWGGMRRLSGFLPLQTVYSDICVLDELWPDFDEAQFFRALEWYNKQDVTLGG